MSCTITYPGTNGPGACNGTNLITACGTWNRPSGSTTGTVHVYGKLYDPGVSAPATPPLTDPDLREATAIESGGLRSWHFNATQLPGALIGSQKKLMIWITADDVAIVEPATPVTFNCCDATSSGCSSAPCLSESAPGARCADLTVIRTIAPRAYRVELDESVVDLANSVRGGGFQFPRVVLEYNLELSTSVRAVWAGRGLAAGVSLHLAVIRSSCGGLCADLTLQRLVPKGVAAPIVWESVTFDLLKGGTFIAARGDACGSVLIVTPDRGGADRAASRPAGESRQQKQPRRRASRR